jgi:hypothetical protein
LCSQKTNNKANDNFSTTLREYFKDMIGLTVQKGETKEMYEQIHMLKTTVRATCINITPNYLNALYERCVLDYYATQERDQYFSESYSDNFAQNNYRVINENDLTEWTEQYNPMEMLVPIYKSPFTKPDRFSAIDIRRDTCLQVQTGQLSELYEEQKLWEQRAQFYEESIDNEDLVSCMSQIFDNGQTVNKLETIIEAQLEKHEKLVQEYEQEWQRNQLLLRELEALNQENIV